MEHFGSDTPHKENKMKYDQYKVSSEVPQKPKKPILPHKHTSQEVTEYAKELEHYEKLMKEYREKLSKRRKEEARLLDKFRDDLLEENGYKPDDPIGLKIYHRAWDKKGSYSMIEVGQYFEELKDFVDEILKIHHESWH
jgi:hypothetical protein